MALSMQIYLSLAAIRAEYSKELCLGNQPLETERWIWPQFLGNWLAGPSVSKIHTGRWKLSAGFDSSFLETGWLAQRGRVPTLSSLLYYRLVTDRLAGVRVGVAMVLVVMMAAVMEWAAAAGRMGGMEGG